MRLQPAVGPQFGFGVYVHWPYCARICPYCDFNVYAAKDREPGPLISAMTADIASQAAMTGRRPATSVFFGGGTPSLLPPGRIAELIAAIGSAWGLGSNAEITLEANPNDLLAADLQGWRTAGVNRLSIGVQSLDDNALRFLGRDHDAAAARAAVEAGLSVFPNLSIDLIYARPGQPVEAWRRELEAALALGAPHLALYELTIAEKTAFAQAVARGDFAPLADAEQADLYLATDAVTDAAGLPAYEISNHARSPVHQSRHNLVYWRSGDWAGVGPGAHGRLTADGQRFATTGERRPADYIRRVEDLGYGWADCEPLDALGAARETLAMGLRPVEGIEIDRIERLAGRRLDAGMLSAFEADGLIALSRDRLSLTLEGRLFADRIAAELSP